MKTNTFAILLMGMAMGMSCSPNIRNPITKKSPLPSPSVIEKSATKKQQAIELAKNFMRIAYGPTTSINLIGNYPPRATYYPQTKRWNVFFTNGVSTCNVELDSESLKGTVSRMDGKIYKRFSNEDVTIYNLPLFTLDEFEEIMKSSHNKF